ncbi:conjugal transfer protein TraD [Aliihoeflea sp. 40Bstr573]|uniref:conjugal transfer protein TraD n=1 Tax=Aliihoeflea sp. 40Bstr573 TaxID=2696467 RepID=UPI0020965D90|nr:conjugal transfer protein TraD [Aliihoeflea sp. 40Bstr573]MCO6387769.1 conjugal transfer protein TraD [Aliihoeflea sp. 40Bstr573]
MRAWQVERRKRTRHLIELGGLVVKAGIVDLTGDDRAMIYGALIWMVGKLNSEDGARARGVWTKLGKMGLEVECKRDESAVPSRRPHLPAGA